MERGIYCVYKLIKEYKFSNIVLLIIGDGPQRKVLEKLVEWLGIKNSVQFLGLIPHREVAKYCSITNLFLSLYDITNLGNPVLEALYFGIPIITISDEGTRQLLEDGYNLYL
ncbi:Alpha-monoglucosyldiacylglycerol synthase [subsurface metagenome]